MQLGNSDWLRAPTGLILLLVVAARAAAAEESSNETRSSPAVERLLQDGRPQEPVYAPTCPPGYYDKTRGAAFFWACGRGCPGGSYTWDDCSCACTFGTTTSTTTTPTTPPPVVGGATTLRTTTPAVTTDAPRQTQAPQEIQASSDDEGISTGLIIGIVFTILVSMFMCAICLAFVLIMYSRQVEEELEAQKPKPHLVKAVSRVGKQLDQRYQHGRNIGRRFSTDMLGAPVATASAGKKLIRRLSMTLMGRNAESVARTQVVDSSGDNQLRKSGQGDPVVDGIVYFTHTEGSPVTTPQANSLVAPFDGTGSRTSRASRTSRNSGDGGHMKPVTSVGSRTSNHRNDQRRHSHHSSGSSAGGHSAAMGPVHSNRSAAMGQTHSNRSGRPYATGNMPVGHVPSNRSTQPSPMASPLAVPPAQGRALSNTSQASASLAAPPPAARVASNTSQASASLAAPPAASRVASNTSQASASLAAPPAASRITSNTSTASRSRSPSPAGIHHRSQSPAGTLHHHSPVEARTGADHLHKLQSPAAAGTGSHTLSPASPAGAYVPGFVARSPRTTALRPAQT